MWGFCRDLLTPVELLREFVPRSTSLASSARVWSVCLSKSRSYFVFEKLK